ncbi:transposable element Tcb1 transposase [Trichonephila clavipes]|nr:transposable element Tcb1 transposase [Trichonephila clavipes]
MTSRKRMEDSERWCAVGRIEAGQLITDVALFFGVHHSAISHLGKQFQTPQTVVRRPLGGLPRVTTPTEDRYIAIIAKRNRRATSTRVTSIVTASIGNTQSAPKHHRTFRIPRQKYYGVGRDFIRIHTDLHIFKWGSVMAVWYRDEVLEPIVRLYAGAVGPTFVLMDDNACPHRADIIDDYLEDEGIMAWPAYSPDLTPIENLWEALGRAVSSRFPPPATLIELETALQEEWRLLNSVVVDHLIESMVRSFNGDRYRVMITNFFIPELNNHDVQELWFQQDGATCHTAHATIDLLKDTFGDRLISRFGPVNWPPRSCDLTPLDYFLWGYVKSLVYVDKSQTLDHLEDNIRRVIADIRPQMLEKIIQNWTSRLDYIRASRGSHMPENIFKM